jgi:hypothetical protein
MVRVWCHTLVAVATVVACAAPVSVAGWGGQGHRLVGRIADTRLSPVARRNVRWLIGGRRLDQVGLWADAFVDGNYQTALWHYVNIPESEVSYDRERDCPTQADAPQTGRGSRWRDCVVDRIEYHAARLADRSLDRADRAVALKFLVHLVADIHQPFHAIATARGGNGIRVEWLGSPDCQTNTGTTVPCNLHAVWDTALMRHRDLQDAPYAAALEREIGRQGWTSTSEGAPADWAAESLAAAKLHLVANGSRVGKAYYARAIGVADERLARAGLRLAELLNRRLADEPPGR